MSLRRTRHRQERRRRALAAVLKVALVVGGLATTAFYSYRVGIELTRTDLEHLSGEVARLERLAGERGAEVERLRAALAEAEGAVGKLRDAAAHAPEGDDARALMRLVQDKLRHGVARERLASFIAAAEQPRQCGEVTVKRFMARTLGIRNEGGGAVRFGDALTITASGTAAQSAQGKEHWFDPAKPVSVVFTEVGGKESEITGVLPLQHVLVIRNQEHRFSFTAGSRGFIEVAGERCQLAAG